MENYTLSELSNHLQYVKKSVSEFSTKMDYCTICNIPNTNLAFPWRHVEMMTKYTPTYGFLLKGKGQSEYVGNIIAFTLELRTQSLLDKITLLIEMCKSAKRQNPAYKMGDGYVSDIRNILIQTDKHITAANLAIAANAMRDYNRKLIPSVAELFPTVAAKLLK